MAPVLDNESPGVHHYQLRILQWNANSVHRELSFLEELVEATVVDVACIQEATLQSKDKIPVLRNFSAVRRDRPVKRGTRGLMIYFQK